MPSCLPRDDHEVLPIRPASPTVLCKSTSSHMHVSLYSNVTLAFRNSIKAATWTVQSAIEFLSILLPNILLYT